MKKEWNSAQLESITSPSPSLFIEGPHKSGKTEVLCARLKRLLDKDGSLTQVAVFVPFTQHVLELEAKLKSTLGAQFERVKVSTLTAWAISVLRTLALGTHHFASFSVKTPQDIAQFLTQFPLWDDEIQLTLSEFVEALPQAKAKGTWPSHWAPVSRQKAGELLTQLTRVLGVSKCLDLYDCCLQAQAVYQKNSKIATLFGIELLVVDGWDLFSAPEQQLLTHLSSFSAHLFTGKTAPTSLSTTVTSLTTSFEQPTAAVVFGPEASASERARIAVQTLHSHPQSWEDTWVITTQIDDRLALQSQARKEGFVLHTHSSPYAVFPESLSLLRSYATALHNPHDTQAILEVARSLSLSQETVLQAWNLAVRDGLSLWEWTQQNPGHPLVSTLTPLFDHIQDLMSGYQEGKFGTLELLQSVSETLIPMEEEWEEDRVDTVAGSLHAFFNSLEENEIQLETLLDQDSVAALDLPAPVSGASLRVFHIDSLSRYASLSCATLVIVGLAPSDLDCVSDLMPRCTREIWIFPSTSHPWETSLKATFPNLVFLEAPAPTLPPAFVVGQSIWHDTFGEGKIESISGQGDQLALTVQFEDSTKQLLAKYAPIKGQPS